MTYAAAAMDDHARPFFAAAVVLCHGLAIFLLWLAVTRSAEGPWYAWALHGIAIVIVAAAPWHLLAGMPTEFVVDAQRVTIRRRWRPSKSFVHQGRAERFHDADGLRRRRLYGSGSPTFSSIVTATTDLPGGKVYFALTDRDRAVVVHRPEGPLLVSPADVDGFLQAINGVDQMPPSEEVATSSHSRRPEQFSLRLAIRVIPAVVALAALVFVLVRR